MADQTLAQMVRVKYPHVYDDLSDQQLEAAVDAKHPGAYADVPRTTKPPQSPAAPQPTSFLQRIQNAAAAMNGPEVDDSPSGQAAERQANTDIMAGVAKGAANTAIGTGRLVNKFTPVGLLNRGLYRGPVPDSTFDAARHEFATPTNDAQKLGYYTEQGAEFLAPSGPAERGAATVTAHLSSAPSVIARLAGRMPMNAAANAAVSGLQGGDAGTAAVVGAALPVAGEAASGAVDALGPWSRRLVRSAIKPTVTAMRQQSGASMTGIDAQADRLVRFIVDNGITSADKAQAIITNAEQEVQRLVGGSTATTDAPQRAQRYLEALSSSASRQGLPARDVNTIRSAMSELLQQSPLSETVMRPTMIPSPSGLLDVNGRPVMVPSHEPVRQLRTDVPPAEALDVARSSGRWGNRKAWGEMKGADTEASKAVERAARDSVKAAVPESRSVFQRQGQAITAKSVFDRMQFRDANREPVSPFDVTTAAVELGQGRPPVMAVARAFLRDNKVRMGVWARQLEDALSRDDVKASADILSRFGVGVDQSSEPQPVPSH